MLMCQKNPKLKGGDMLMEKKKICAWDYVFTKKQRDRLVRSTIKEIKRLREILGKNKLTSERDGFDLSEVGDHYMFINSDGSIVIRRTTSSYGEWKHYEDAVANNDLAEFIAIYQVEPDRIRKIISKLL